MKQDISSISETLQQTLDELQEKHPEAGFVLIGLAEGADHTGVSLAYNLDDDTVQDVMLDVVNGTGTTIFPMPAGKLLN